MLPRSAYQTIAACELYDADLPKSEKLEILEFIEYASQDQLLHYLIHGEMVNEDETQLVEIGFILSTALITAASAAGRAVYSKFNSAGAAACRDKEGLARKSCLKDFKVRGASGKISVLRREMGKCNQTKNPDKCRKMFMRYIENTEKQIRKIQTESYKN